MGPPGAASGALIVAIGCTVLAKLCCYGNLRAFYPLSQYLAETWGMSSSDFSVVLAAAELASVPAVLIGPLSDTLGPRRFVVPSVVGAALATLATALLPKTVWILATTRFVFGFALAVFDVTAQNCLLEMAREDSKERITSLLESSWSLSALTIVPLLALILSRSSASTAIISLALITLMAALILFVALRSVPARPILAAETQLGLKSGLVWSSGALAFNLSALFFAMAHNLVISEFSILIENEFNLSAEEAGQTQLVLGGAELLGAVLVGVAGSSPSTFFLSSLAFIMGILFYAMFASLTLWGALLGLFFVYVPGEFSIILRLARASSFATPADANSMLAMCGVFLFTGRTLGPLLSVPLYEIGHFEVCLVATFSALVSLGCIVLAEWLRKGSFWWRADEDFATVEATEERERFNEE